MRRDFAQRIAIKHRINLANPEFYTRAVLAGAKVEEVEVQHAAREKGTSTMDFSRTFRLFKTVNDHFQELRNELASRAKAS